VAAAVDRNDKDVFPPILPAAAGVAALALAVVFTLQRRSTWAFTMTAVGTVMTVATLFISLYPRVMVSSGDFSNSLTVDGSASADYTLKVMTVVAVIFLPIVLIYQGWTYHVFRHRILGSDLITSKQPTDAPPALGEPAGQ
jgi:cytochrome bd ubiquinol oxidase subunit II